MRPPKVTQHSATVSKNKTLIFPCPKIKDQENSKLKFFICAGSPYVMVGRMLKQKIAHAA